MTDQKGLALISYRQDFLPLSLPRSKCPSFRQTQRTDSWLYQKLRWHCHCYLQVIIGKHSFVMLNPNQLTSTHHPSILSLLPITRTMYFTKVRSVAICGAGVGIPCTPRPTAMQVSNPVCEPAFLDSKKRSKATCGGSDKGPEVDLPRSPRLQKSSAGQHRGLMCQGPGKPWLGSVHDNPHSGRLTASSRVQVELLRS